MKIFEIVDKEPVVVPGEHIEGKPPEKRAYTRRNRVTSTWIAGLDYDYRRNVAIMKLSDGRAYDVNGIDARTYRSWVNAPSKGKFFHRHVRDNYSIT